MATRSSPASGARPAWSERYAAATKSGEPARLLVEWLERLPRGRALDVACGTGANLLALAAHGFSEPLPVLGIDISPVALHVAAAAARRRRLAVDLVAADLATYPLPRACFDLVCVFRFLDRTLVPALVETLRPGGYLIYQTFTVDQLQLGGGPRSPAWLLGQGELRALFSDLRVLHYDERVQFEPGRPEALASLVARRL